MSIPQQLQELIKQAVASGDEKALAELMATIQLAASQARAETAQEALTPEQRAELEEQRALVMARLKEEEAHVKELREERDQRIAEVREEYRTRIDMAAEAARKTREELREIETRLGIEQEMEKRARAAGERMAASLLGRKPSSGGRKGTGARTMYYHTAELVYADGTSRAYSIGSAKYPPSRIWSDMLKLGVTKGNELILAHGGFNETAEVPLEGLQVTHNGKEVLLVRFRDWRPIGNGDNEQEQ